MMQKVGGIAFLGLVLNSKFANAEPVVFEAQAYDDIDELINFRLLASHGSNETVTTVPVTNGTNGTNVTNVTDVTETVAPVDYCAGPKQEYGANFLDVCPVCKGPVEGQTAKMVAANKNKMATMTVSTDVKVTMSLTTPYDNTAGIMGDRDLTGALVQGFDDTLEANGVTGEKMTSITSMVNTADATDSFTQSIYESFGVATVGQTTVAPTTAPETTAPATEAPTDAATEAPTDAPTVEVTIVKSDVDFSLACAADTCTVDAIKADATLYGQIKTSLEAAYAASYSLDASQVVMENLGAAARRLQSQSGDARKLQGSVALTASFVVTFTEETKAEADTLVSTIASADATTATTFTNELTTAITTNVGSDYTPSGVTIKEATKEVVTVAASAAAGSTAASATDAVTGAATDAATDAPTDAATPAPSPADAPTDTASPAPTDTASPAPSPADTASPAPSPTDTASPAPSPADTASPAPSPADTASPAPSPTDTASPAPSPADTASPAPSPTDTASPAPSPADTPTDTATPAPADSPTQALPDCPQDCATQCATEERRRLSAEKRRLAPMSLEMVFTTLYDNEDAANKVLAATSSDDFLTSFATTLGEKIEAAMTAANLGAGYAIDKSSIKAYEATKESFTFVDPDATTQASSGGGSAASPSSSGANSVLPSALSSAASLFTLLGLMSISLI